MQINRASLHYHSKHFALKIQKKNTHKLLHSLRPRVFWVAKISSNQTKANMKFRKNRPQDAHGFPWSISQAPLATSNSRRHVPTIHLRNLRTDRSGKTADDLGAGELGNFRENPKSRKKIPKIVSPPFDPIKSF